MIWKPGTALGHYFGCIYSNSTIIHSVLITLKLTLHRFRNNGSTNHPSVVDTPAPSWDITSGWFWGCVWIFSKSKFSFSIIFFMYFLILLQFSLLSSIFSMMFSFATLSLRYFSNSFFSSLNLLHSKKVCSGVSSESSSPYECEVFQWKIMLRADISWTYLC